MPLDISFDGLPDDTLPTPSLRGKTMPRRPLEPERAAKRAHAIVHRRRGAV